MKKPIEAVIEEVIIQPDKIQPIIGNRQMYIFQNEINYKI